MNEHLSANPEQQAEADAIQRGHELDTVQVRTISIIAGGFTLLTLGVLGLMAIIATWFGKSPTIESQTSTETLQPESPVYNVPLDPNQPRHLAEVRQQEAARLESYGWIDHESGIARIPIQRAMEIIAEQGFDSIPIVKPPPKLPGTEQTNSPLDNDS